jgi:hypothetical protein
MAESRRRIRKLGTRGGRRCRKMERRTYEKK